VLSLRARFRLKANVAGRWWRVTSTPGNLRPWWWVFHFTPMVPSTTAPSLQALVVGVPFHPDGAEHDNTRFARRFARELRQRFGLPVFEVDERYSTTEALAQGARDADAASACIILEQFLRNDLALP